MFRKVILVLAIFFAILLALSFGENAFRQAFSWLITLATTLSAHLQQGLDAVARYLRTHSGQVLLAIVFTIPVSWWVLRTQQSRLEQPVNRRRIAIVLALFLGWLGAHRFYLGQIGWGVAYLILAYWLPPLAVIAGIVDAIRYLIMDAESLPDPNREAG